MPLPSPRPIIKLFLYLFIKDICRLPQLSLIYPAYLYLCLCLYLYLTQTQTNSDFGLGPDLDWIWDLGTGLGLYIFRLLLQNSVSWDLDVNILQNFAIVRAPSRQILFRSHGLPQVVSAYGSGGKENGGGSRNQVLHLLGPPPSCEVNDGCGLYLIKTLYFQDCLWGLQQSCPLGWLCHGKPHPQRVRPRWTTQQEDRQGGFIWLLCQGIIFSQW